MNPPQPRANLDALLAILQRALGHEVPNHLIAVQGMARLLELEESERLGPDGRDYLQRLSAAAQRAHGQVRALADFIRALRSQAPAAPVSLPDVVREAATEVNQLFSGCSIEYHFPEHGPYLRMPGTALRQVVVSLLRNARGAALPEQILRVEIGAR